MRMPMSVASTTNPTATTTTERDAERRDRTLRHDARHDGQDDETENVVGDRRAEHGLRFDGRERAKVAEHAGGDADARRRQRGADEERFLAVHADRETDARARHQGNDHADERDGERGAGPRRRARRDPSRARPRAATR